jgi:signal transduction histidine kinase
VLIERVLVDGRPVSVPVNDLPVRLPPDHRKIEVEFTALNFAAPESILLQHQLAGWDDAWSEPKAERSVAYSRLGAGSYEFQVTARNAAGIWNREGAKFNFIVEPFLYQRWWFRLLVISAFTFVVIAVVRYASFRRLRTRVQRLEQEAALARDRARIAQDLHDDLGANLTQIALLSELAQNDFNKPDEARGHIDQIFRTAKSLTRSLDEIVWAVNPKNDSLDRFVAHLCTYAPEFLRSAGVRCRLDVPVEVPSITLPSDVRHHLHLGVKEALHNVAKHAGASEARVQLRLNADELVVVIADDGAGFGATPADGQDGLANLATRMREVGGKYERGGGTERGTVITLTVPLRPRPPKAGGSA